MRFQVPQFIDVEDHIFGPFTFRQFIYIAGGIGLSFVMLRIFPRYLAYIIDLVIILFSLALAFYRINNRPFISVIESAIKFFFGSRLYIWKHKDSAATPTPEALVAKYTKMSVPKMSDSKLKELSWRVDMKTPTPEE